MARYAILFLTALFVESIAAGVENTPDGPMRTWTDASGEHTTEARFVRWDGDHVTLFTRDGRTVTLSTKKLSVADRDYLRAGGRTPKPGPWIELIGPEGPTGIAKVGPNITHCGDVRTGPGKKTLEPLPGKGVLAALGKLKYGRGNNLSGKEAFGDCEVQLEFLIATGSNSGVKLQERYEIQLFDSHRKKKPSAKDCGGIYPHWKFGGRGKGLIYIDEGIPPKVNAAKPAGEWQTLQVIFTAPRFDAARNKTENARFDSVVLNGKTIHENVELDSPTGNASSPLPEISRAPLFLQLDHGGVAFRNVRVRHLGKPGPKIVARKKTPVPDRTPSP